MNILFIGNSYTYYNDMPDILRSLLEENGYDICVDAVTKGGRRLYENLLPEDEYNKKIAELIRAKRYDLLFLQEQSYLSLVDYERFETALKELKELIGADRTVLYSTWGRKEGSELLGEYGWTSESMTNALTAAYQRAAQTIGAEISPVGSCFLALSRSHPDTELYNKDLSHPSYEGSCVAAVAHYIKIVGALPKKHSSIALDECMLNVIKSTVETNTRKES